MPVESRVKRCGQCGAPLRPTPGSTVFRCEYCGGTTFLGPASGAVTGAVELLSPPPASLHARLLGGPLDEGHGLGERHSVEAMSARDVPARERGLWPVQASASSTFGGNWSPSVLVGPPRVYPRSGDLQGAWAPGPRSSHVEWIELRYAHGVPSSAIRVFETNCAGSTFAVVDATEGEELLYAAPPTALPGAQVLEVTLSPPRTIRRLRVYLVNPAWCEVDTVGLLAADPLPEAMRTHVTLSKASTGASLGCVAAIAILGAVVAGAAFFLRGSSTPSAATEAPPRPSLVVAGTRVQAAQPGVDSLVNENVVWASQLGAYSSEYDPDTNGARRVLGAPDVYPSSGDLPSAWASREQDAGPEWITVTWPIGIDARAVVWAETLNPGAVVRVDDLTDPERPAILFEGVVPSAGRSNAIVRLDLPTRRRITSVRLILDTRRVAGWNEIDAIGLVP